MSKLIARFVLIVTVSCFIGVSSSPSFAASSDGWWVVVGVIPGDEFNVKAANSLHARIRRCGFEAFNDFSDKFTGFSGGLTVFVLGAYANKGEADGILKKMKVCVPDAYIKRGRYLGE